MVRGVASKRAASKASGRIAGEAEKVSESLQKLRGFKKIKFKAQRLVKKFLPKKRYREMAVVDVEELAKKQGLKPNLQLFAEDEFSKIKFGSSVKSETKLMNQIKRRGWNRELINKTISKPYATRTSVNKATGNKATVFYTKRGSYITIDDITREVVQISDNIEPSNWIPDTSINNPFKPWEN